MNYIFLEVEILKVNCRRCAFAQSSQEKKSNPYLLVESESWQSSFSQKFIDTYNIADFIIQKQDYNIEHLHQN